MLLDTLWNIYQEPHHVKLEVWKLHLNHTKTMMLIQNEIKHKTSKWVCSSVSIRGITDCLETCWKSKSRNYFINIHHNSKKDEAKILKLEAQLRVLIHVLDMLCGKYDAYVDIIFTPTKKTVKLSMSCLHVCNMNSGYCHF